MGLKNISLVLLKFLQGPCGKTILSGQSHEVNARIRFVKDGESP